MKDIFLASLLIVLAFSSAHGFTLSLKHTILSAPNLTEFQKHQQLLQISKHRTSDSIRAPISLALSGSFYAEVQIGTPPVKANLVLDTGSSLTWTQCAQCQVCFSVAVPNFDPRRSITYRRMPYNHPLCPSEPAANSSGRFCSYELQYYDGEVIRGDLALETFTFGSDSDDGSGSKQQLKLPNVAFGCGLDNQNVTDFVNDTRNPISGVFGIGRDPSSILQQLGSITLQKFSYCLPQLLFGDSVHHHRNHHTLLHFGNDAKITGHGVQTTPILEGWDGSYYLKLDAISFNGRLLPIDPKLFLTNGFGVVMDSGTPYTFFVETAYNQLRQAVVEYFLENSGLKPLDSTMSGFPLCYNDTIHHQGRDFAFPTIKLHFQGAATLELKQSTSFQVFKDVNEICLMITPTTDTSGVNLLGAFQQVNYRFLFDVGASKLSFAPEIC